MFKRAVVCYAEAITEKQWEFLSRVGLVWNSIWLVSNNLHKDFNKKTDIDVQDCFAQLLRMDTLQSSCIQFPPDYANDWGLDWVRKKRLIEKLLILCVCVVFLGG